MNDEENLIWSALEYEDKYRSRDWFWALGVVAVTIAATSIIFGNYFFAVLILISSGLLWFFAVKPPEEIQYNLNKKGLTVKSHTFLFEEIKSFYVQKEGKPILFLKTDRFFMPIISMPIEWSLADEIKKRFEDGKVTEEEMKEHPSEKIMDTLGF